jgi:hypothetical protein
LSRLEQRFLAVKVEEGRRSKMVDLSWLEQRLRRRLRRSKKVRTLTSCYTCQYCQEGSVENIDLSWLEQRLLAVKKVKEG